MTCCIVKEFMDQYLDRIHIFVMQISMSVWLMTPTTVMRMHSALTQRGVTPALVTLVTLEMESTVQVSLRAAFLIAIAHYGLN